MIPFMASSIDVLGQPPGGFAITTDDLIVVAVVLFILCAIVWLVRALR